MDKGLWCLKAIERIELNGAPEILFFEVSAKCNQAIVQMQKNIHEKLIEELKVPLIYSYEADRFEGFLT